MRVCAPENKNKRINQAEVEKKMLRSVECCGAAWPVGWVVCELKFPPLKGKVQKEFERVGL